MQTRHDTDSSFRGHDQSARELFRKLSPAAQLDLESMGHTSSYLDHHVLFSEKEPAHGVFVVIDGEVKLSVNSTDGRRLSLNIARKSEILGLTSVFSGSCYEMTAETLHPSKIAFISQSKFFSFLSLHPEAAQPLMAELGRQYSTACEQLRTLGLSSSTPEKLARLLLDWSETGQTTEAGTRFRFSLTHEEIGEFIGASRETVTRTLSVFKSRRLVTFKGSTLTILSKTALANYARC